MFNFISNIADDVNTMLSNFWEVLYLSLPRWPDINWLDVYYYAWLAIAFSFYSYFILLVAGAISV